jgi:hypothetical protein
MAVGVVSVAAIGACKAVEELQDHLSGVQFEMRASKVDPTTGTFTSVAAPATKREAVSITHDGAIYSIGGLDGSLKAQPPVEKLDPKTKTWTTLAPWPTPRVTDQFWELGGQLCTVGGTSVADGFQQAVNCYDPTTNAWSERKAVPDTAGKGGIYRGTVANDKLYVFAQDGTTASGDANPFVAQTYPDAGVDAEAPPPGALEPDDFYVYDLASDTWTQKKTAPFACSREAPYARGKGKERMVAIGNSLYVIDCPQKLASGAIASAALVYDMAADSWTEIPPAPLTYPGFAFAIDGKVVAVSRVAPFVATLDPSTRTWSTPKALVPPMLPSSLSVTPDGSSLLFLDLEDTDGKNRVYSGDLWRYDLAGDIWKKIGTMPHDVDKTYLPVFEVLVAGGETYVVGGWESAVISIH